MADLPVDAIQRITEWFGELASTEYTGTVFSRDEMAAIIDGAAGMLSDTFSKSECLEGLREFANGIRDNRTNAGAPFGPEHVTSWSRYFRKRYEVVYNELGDDSNELVARLFGVGSDAGRHDAGNTANWVMRTANRVVERHDELIGDSTAAKYGIGIPETVIGGTLVIDAGRRIYKTFSDRKSEELPLEGEQKSKVWRLLGAVVEGAVGIALGALGIHTLRMQPGQGIG